MVWPRSVGVVLDDDDGVAAVEEGAEGGEEFLDVVEVEAGSGLRVRLG